MLKIHLQDAIDELEKLIDFTKDDIELIKDTKHDEVTKRQKAKEQILTNFETKKTKLNQVLEELYSNSNDGLQSVLDSKDEEMLELFKIRLLELKEVNRDFMAIVVAVREFYHSLFSTMFRFDSQGYNKTNPLPEAVLKVSA